MTSAELAQLTQRLRIVQEAIRAQLLATATEVEQGAVALAADVFQVHRIARQHRERSREVFDRLLLLSNGAALDAGSPVDRLAFIHQVLGPEEAAQIARAVASVGTQMGELEVEHSELVRHTNPLVPALQIFDAIRQLVEHAAVALDSVIRALEPLANPAAGEAAARQARSALDQLVHSQLSSIFFTEVERRTLASLDLPGVETPPREGVAPQERVP